MEMIGIGDGYKKIGRHNHSREKIRDLYKIEDEMTGRKKKSKTEDIIPEEINDHLKLFGKEPWEVDYNKFGRCEMCGSRIDEFGYCACSAGSVG